VSSSGDQNFSEPGASRLMQKRSSVASQCVRVCSALLDAMFLTVFFHAHSVGLQATLHVAATFSKGFPKVHSARRFVAHEPEIWISTPGKWLSA
jgi:hypothetical protein